MKFHWLLLFAMSFMYSCREYCDPATAEGAAECSCKLMRDFKAAEGDEQKRKEVTDRYDQFMYEYDKNISEGNYTEKEVNELINKKDNCK